MIYKTIYKGLQSHLTNRLEMACGDANSSALAKCVLVLVNLQTNVLLFWSKNYIHAIELSAELHLSST